MRLIDILICITSLVCPVLLTTVPGSCRGQCDIGRVGNCFCNEHCRRHGDCCHDYLDTCQQWRTQRVHHTPRQTTGSCSGGCYVGRVGNCYCNAHCFRHGDCCHDYTSYCSNTQGRRSFVPTISANATITQVVEALWSSDTNRFPSSGLTLDFQGVTTRTEEGDRASRPLFSHVDESIFNRSTYRQFIRLLDNYNPDVNDAEHISFNEENEIEAFLESITTSNSMVVLREYFFQRGLIENSANAFKLLLRSLWFDLYRRRSRGAVSSSGFEHVMVGEVRGTKVTGFHNWIQFYQEETRGRLNYEGYISKRGTTMLRAKLTWQGKKKDGASMFVGVSPEFDMAVYTLCIMLEPNRNCEFNLHGDVVRVRTYDNNLVPGIQVATAFINV